MNRIYVIFLSAIAALLLLPAGAVLTAQESKFVEASKEIKWSKSGPMDFLDILKKNKYSIVVVDTSDKPPRDWINREDVARLMQVIESVEPAAPVISKDSPYLPSEGSTVGNEAMFLIEGFRKKSYPPLSASVYYFKPEVNQYKLWWLKMAMEAEVNSPVGAGAAVYQNSPTRQDILADSKPAQLSVVDELLLKYDSIRQGAAVTNVLVNRITGIVEYVWAASYQSYVRPKYVMPKAQELYNRTH